jgi:hypothetical protein
MSRVRLRTPGVVLLMLLAFPHQARADFFDFIWEMSGWQAYGAVILHCKTDLAGGGTECRLLDWKRLTPPIAERNQRKAWLAFNGTVYTSSGKDAEGNNYKKLENHMVALDPLIEVQVLRAFLGLTPYHGVFGGSFNFMVGRDYRRFFNAGLKFKPFGATFRLFSLRGDAAYTFRLYPDGFSRDEFGFAPSPPGVDDSWERVHGFSFGLGW